MFLEISSLACTRKVIPGGDCFFQVGFGWWCLFMLVVIWWLISVIWLVIILWLMYDLWFGWCDLGILVGLVVCSRNLQARVLMTFVLTRRGSLLFWWNWTPRREFILFVRSQEMVLLFGWIFNLVMFVWRGLNPHGVRLDEFNHSEVHYKELKPVKFVWMNLKIRFFWQMLEMLRVCSLNVVFRVDFLDGVFKVGCWHYFDFI